MEFEKFASGKYIRRTNYKSFEPTKVNIQWTWKDATINTLLEDANHALGGLNAFSHLVPDVDRFIYMHLVKEAQTSTKIEGTQTGIADVLMAEEFVKPELRDDRKEVLNYITAINFAIDGLSNLPLSNRLLRDTHNILLKGVRGQHKLPGEFRTSQNWIGGSNISNAAFIPPHQDGVPDLMGDLEAFWYNDRIQVPHLIRIAISHYQFETIHPFLDGNGRIGRLLVPLYLVSKKLLDKPSLYLSDFFEKHRQSYYDALTRVRISNDMIHWIRFFLTGVTETAKKGCRIFSKILEMQKEAEVEVRSLSRRAANGLKILDYLYLNPITTSQAIAKKLSMSAPTVNALLQEFIKMGILEESTGQSWGRMYVFGKYLRLFTDE